MIQIESIKVYQAGNKKKGAAPKRTVPFPALTSFHPNNKPNPPPCFGDAPHAPRRFNGPTRDKNRHTRITQTKISPKSKGESSSIRTISLASRNAAINPARNVPATGEIASFSKNLISPRTPAKNPPLLRTGSGAGAGRRRRADPDVSTCRHRLTRPLSSMYMAYSLLSRHTGQSSA